jgi:boron transporter
MNDDATFIAAITNYVVPVDGQMSDGTTEVSMVNVTDTINPKGDNENDCSLEINSDDDVSSSLSSNKGSIRCHQRRIFGMKGLQKDWKYHKSTYKDEWTRRPKSISKVIAATIFAFFTQLIPALIFADVLDTMTHGNISVIETLLSAGIIGAIYSIITGQSLVLLGITGPVAILLGTSYGLAETFDTDYYSFFFYICIWTSLMHILTAMNDTIMDFVRYITPFTSSTFEFFIGITFIYESLRDLIEPLHLLTLQEATTIAATDETQEDSNNILATTALSLWISLVIGIFAFTICYTLHFAEHWIYFNYPIRAFLSSYSMVISVTIVTAFSYFPGVHNPSTSTGGIERVHVTAPWDWKPSDPTRSWITNPTVGISWKGILGAMFPALMLYLLFFIDHNISSILTQDPKFNLKKKPTYHWDFFCLGITIIPCAILGLPPGSGLIPQAPLHTRALATRMRYEENGMVMEVTTYVEEQRYSAFGQSLLMFLALVSFHAIALIPKSALYGIFLYLGVGALYNNDIWHRFLYMFMTLENRPSLQLFDNVKWSTIQIYTIIEILFAFVIFGVANFAPIGTISMICKSAFSQKTVPCTVHV